MSPSATSTLSSGTPVFSDGELREDRVRAGADVLRAAGDAGRAVVAELDAGLGGKRAGDPGAAGHAPAERQAVALHRADLGRALRPAELFRAELEALEQMPRGERNAHRLVDLRLVEDAELDRVDLELIGQLVHRRLGGVEPGHRAGAAHGGRRADVAPGAAERHAQVGHAVLERRRLAAVFVVVVEDRRVVDVVVLERDELAVGRGAEPHALLRCAGDGRPSGTSSCG